MKVAVTFADPEALAKSYFESVLVGRAEAYAADTVSNKFPKVALAGDATHLQVEVDGTPTLGATYPVTKRTTLRVTAYSSPTNQNNAKDLHDLALALLAAHPGNADVVAFVPLTGDLKTTDPATGNNLVSFTMRADMVAHVL